MVFHAVSLHVDRADQAMSRSAATLVRVPPQADWSAALREVTTRTAAPFASVYLGLHDSKTGSHYFDYAALAHRRDEQGQLIPPQRPEDALFKPGTLDPVADVLTRFVRAEVVSAPLNTVRADDHIYLNVSPKAHHRISMALALTSAAPPLYNIAKSNCVIVEKSILKAGDVTLPPLPDSVAVGPRRLQTPNHLSTALQALADAKVPVDGVILSGVPRLLGQYVPG